VVEEEPFGLEVGRQCREELRHVAVDVDNRVTQAPVDL
jgi:hypothetical protein